MTTSNGLSNRSSWLAALLFVCSSCIASISYGCDYSLGPCISELTQETVPPFSTEYRWLSVFKQRNEAAAGENVTLYTKQDKAGSGASWAFVAESRCIEPRGGCHGAEVDLVVNGPVQWGDWRIGQSIVLWGNGQANHALLLGNWFEDKATVERGVTVDLRCSVACVQVPENQKLCFDREGRVCFRLNTNTGRVELLAGERVIVAWPVD